MHPSPILLATAAAVAIATPAGAQTPAPAIAVDHECYSPGDTIHWTGSGFTPNSAVDVFLAGGGAGGQLTGGIAADGSLDLQTTIDFETVDFFVGDGVSTTVRAAAAPHGSAQPPADAPGTSFTLSRWDVAFTRLRAGRSATFEAVGFTPAVGKPLYVHFTRAGRLVKTVRVGTLQGPCGDVSRRVRHAVPKRTGMYELYFSTSPKDPKGGDWMGVTGRVRR